MYCAEYRPHNLYLDAQFPVYGWYSSRAVSHVDRKTERLCESQELNYGYVAKLKYKTPS